MKFIDHHGVRASISWASGDEVDRSDKCTLNATIAGHAIVMTAKAVNPSTPDVENMLEHAFREAVDHQPMAARP